MGVPPAAPCKICQGAHKPNRCPDLSDPLRDGFFTGGGAHRDHGGDDGDEQCKRVVILVADPYKNLNWCGARVAAYRTQIRL
jgi:hypothetical protein